MQLKLVEPEARQALSKLENTLVTGALATGDAERDNWRTPGYILEAVKAFWGTAWRDPCPADPRFDAFDMAWVPCDRLFINPPFSEYLRWAEHFARMRCDQIWLGHHSHDTQWFKTLLHYSSAVLLLKKRVSFIDPLSGEPSASSTPGKCQSLLYKGDDVEGFYNAFKHLGSIVTVFAPREEA